MNSLFIIPFSNHYWHAIFTNFVLCTNTHHLFVRRISMSEEFERNDEQFDSVLEQYESMLKENKVFFFDLEHFEEIFDHYFAKNKISKAEKVLSIAQDQHPYSASLITRHAQILLRRKKVDKAIDLLDKLLHLEPGNPDLFLLLAEAYSEKGEVEKSVRCYLGALPFMEKEEHDYVYMDIAGEYLSNANYEKALEYLQMALEVNPYNDLIYLDVLFGAQVLEKVEFALDLYQKQIDKDAYNHLAWFYSGVALADLDRIEESIEAFDYACVIEPNFSEAFYQKAEMLMSIHKYEEAIGVLKDLKEDMRHSAAASYMLGECYENMSMWHDALHYYRSAAKIDPLFGDAWLSIGVVIFKLGNPDEALAYIKKALKLDPGNVDAYIYLGDIKKERGFFEEAIQAYQKAEELDKTVLDLWLNYSDLLVQMDNVPAAIDLMKKGSEYFKEAPEMLYRWACYEYLQGNKQLAYLLIEDAVVMNANIAENELFSYVPMMKNDTTILHIIYRNKQNEN